MGKARLFTAAAVVSLLAAGCGGSVGFLRDSITQVQVQKGGFRVVKTGLKASAETGQVFCSIQVDDGEVYRRMMEEIHAAARLGPDQMLINIREDIKQTAYLGLYCVRKHTLSADVIEFTREAAPAAPAAPAYVPPAPAFAPAPLATPPAAAPSPPPAAPPRPATTPGVMPSPLPR
jgi:hypothetical protein